MRKVDRKEWKGQNRFVCKGKYMTGSSKDDLTLVLAYGGVSIAFTVYSFTIVKYLHQNTGIFLPILGYFFIITGIYYMLKTTFTDPGVIPRGTLESAEEAMEAGLSLDQESGHSNIPLVRLDDSTNVSSDRILEISTKKETLPDISLYRYRYCHTCKIMRPPKASHCADCDNCVKSFDHHCYFVGNCIGRRNHKYFFLFLFYATLYCVFTALVSAIGFLLTISKYPEVEMQIKEHKGYWIISAVLVFVGLVCCQRKYLEGMRYTIVGLGFVINITGFVLIALKTDLPYYETPLSFVSYILALSPFGLWILSNFGGNLWGIYTGFTLKEKAVIDREILDSRKRKGLYNLTWREKIDNIREFFAREYIESQIRGVH